MFETREDAPILALAPMQAVTDLPFWKILHDRGGPDVYWTEFARVHIHSNPASEREILHAVRENPSGKPAILQLIGSHIPKLVEAARFYQKEPVAAIDLNLGCPAPRVCSNHAGGALLRKPDEIDAIISALRDTITDVGFTVKTRLGFTTDEEFSRLLEVFARHDLDALSIHGRTVVGKYQTPIGYEHIRRAAETLPYPVFANGNVLSPRTAKETLDLTGAAGLMIGRGCIRNPFLFAQIRDGRASPTYREIHRYIEDLWDSIQPPDPKSRLSKIKRYLAFIGQGISDGQFLSEAQRTRDPNDFHRICQTHLSSDAPFPDEPPGDNALFRGVLPTSNTS